MTGNIPVLKADGHSIAEAWEQSLLELAAHGAEIRTEYDAKDQNGNFLDPPSIDCTMLTTIEDPASEPSIHRAFPGGLEDLEEYRREIRDGIKDHWIGDPNDPTDTRWSYTYHGRFTNYDGLDQIEAMAQKLAATPHSRRAYAVTTMPHRDLSLSDPPCCQSLWGRLVWDDDAKLWRFNMNVRFRSRDALDAAFMNLWGFAGPQGLQGKIADHIAELSGNAVACGRYCDLSDSYHVYGNRRQYLAEAVLAKADEPLSERAWTREFAQPIFDEAVPSILAKVKKYDEEHT